MDDEADEESWLILFFIKSCLTEARPAVPGKNMSKQAVLSEALKGTSIILSQKSNQYGISPTSIEWNSLKVSSLSCLPWTNGCGKTQTSVLVEGGSPSMPHIYYFNFRDTVLLFIPSSAPSQTNSQILLFMYPSAMSFHNFPILFSCIQLHLAPSHPPQKDATTRYWASRTTTVMFIFPLIWEIWKQRVFFTRSVSRGIIVYVIGYLNSFYGCWQKDSSLYSNIHNWALLDSATEKWMGADTHFSWFVFTPKYVCGWSWPYRIDWTNMILPITRQLGYTRTNHMKHLAISLQLKLIGTRTNVVLMNPNLYYCGIGTGNFQKRKWEGSHQPQEDRERNRFSGES